MDILILAAKIEIDLCQVKDEIEKSEFNSI